MRFTHHRLEIYSCKTGKIKYEVEFEFLNETGRIFKINFSYTERHL
jgi:hypothetical protein